MKSEYLKPEAVFMKVESTTMLAASPATYMRSESKPAEDDSTGQKKPGGTANQNNNNNNTPQAPTIPQASVMPQASVNNTAVNQNNVVIYECFYPII